MLLQQPRSTLFPYTTLFRSIFEDEGKLWALIEWIEYDLLTEESENVFAFPERGGMYHGEKLVFTDRKSTRLNSSHITISYAVFCLKKKKRNKETKTYIYKES